MSSNLHEYQLPPPGANFSFPPDDNKSLRFNSIDSFVTSWVTPASSSEPCFLSLWFCNGSNRDGPWRSSFNKTMPLNGTATVPLNCVDHGLAQMNLNHVDPIGSHQLSLGAMFNIDYNPTQPKAETWNADALSTSTSSATVLSPQTVATLSGQTPTAAPTKLASSTSSIIPNVSTLTTTPSPSSTSASYSNSGNAGVASIVLGTLLAILITTLVAAVWIRWRRRKSKTPGRLDVRASSSAGTEPTYARGYEVHEIGAEVAVYEVGGSDRPWELPANER